MHKQYCTQCGHTISPNANFCAYCGIRIDHDEQYATSTIVTPIFANEPPESSETPKNKQAEQEDSEPKKVIVERRSLAPRSQVIFFINYIIMTAILLPFMIGFLFFDVLFGSIIITIYVLLCCLTAMITYHNFYYTVDSSGFEKAYGIIFKRSVGIPYEHIQNVNITRTLLDRFLGIARLDIETAGRSSPRKREIVGGIRSHAEGHLPGITVEEARFLHDLLIKRANVNGKSKP